MSDLIIRNETQSEELSRPPLYLQYYLDEREGRPFAPEPKPPGTARVIERRDNLIVLEFRDRAIDEETSVSGRRSRLDPLCRGGWDAAMLLLLLLSVVSGVASFCR